ncbi:phosphate ABC transporter substrate-binding protein, PhoT family [Ekhidna lutea]|uniref:Phosphate ABC transporter substrate-binding protein, PhoT family n=1 Tax=Ekhidna lutea TaxID=447679 RepID=A0A239HX29_EKHLU|nr:substrate-binding domain-containing protein [Ekhidna lutea]SNS85879.1 phosphate ABC transporter substrate-binding protein, PhoT family [Ekhidna lutea]
MKRLLFSLLVCFFLGCDTIQNPKDYQPLKLKGSESMHETFANLASDFERLQDTIKVELEGGGSRTGLLAIKDQTADIGLSSFPFDLDSILGENHTIDQRVVAYDGIVVINHLDNPIGQLTDDQISNIYSGVVTDWAELGGVSGSIMPVVRDSNSGTQKFFTQHYNIFELAPTVVVAGENREIVDSVISNKNSIGFIGYSYYTAMVKNVELPALGAKSKDTVAYVAPEPDFINSGQYPLKRSLRIYYEQLPDKRVMAFLQYLDSDRAKEIIESHGLIIN